MATPVDTREDNALKMIDFNQRVESLCGNDLAASKMFRELINGWSGYHLQHKTFNFMALIKTTEFLLAKEMDRFQKDHKTATAHVIKISYILWTDGRVRSVNVLTAALLDHIHETGVSDEEIQQKFGKRVSSTLNEDHPPTKTEEEHLQAHLDLAPTQSLDGQMIQLAHLIERLRSCSWMGKMSIKEAGSWLTGNQKLLDALHRANVHLEFALNTEIQEKAKQLKCAEKLQKNFQKNLNGL